MVEAQRVNFLPDGGINGWADTPVRWYSTVVLENAFADKLTNIPLLYNHDRDIVAGTIYLLEYRDGGLWLEGKLTRVIETTLPHYFGAGFYLKEWRFTEDNICEVVKGELLEISIFTIPAQKAE